MFSKLKIGDFVAINGLSTQALRYYERIGLLTPALIDEETKYRYYTLNQSARIDMIQFLQQLNFSLEEIKKLLAEQNSLHAIDQQLTNKKALLEQQLQEIEFKTAAITRFKEANSVYESNQQKKEIEILRFPKRAVYSYLIEKNIYEMIKEEYEYSLRQFKLHLTQMGFPSFYFTRVGSIMPREKFIQNQFYSNELFVIVDGKNNKVKDAHILQKGLYAVTYCESFEEELAMIKNFRAEISRLNYVIIGDYICEVIYEVPRKGKHSRSMFIRLQVQIEPTFQHIHE